MLADTAMEPTAPMKLRSPKALLLDLDDTILDDTGNVEACWDTALESCAPELGDLDTRALRATIRSTSRWYWSDPERHRIGRLNLAVARREVVRLALLDHGRDDAGLASAIGDVYSREREAGIQLFPEAVETVRWCRQAGYRLALLTNGSAAAQRAKLSRFRLDDLLFDAILVEGELGFGKPDPRVYRLALQALDTDPVDTWMIGDNLEWDVLQPQRMGITGIWINGRGEQLPASIERHPACVIRSLSDVRQLLAAWPRHIRTLEGPLDQKDAGTTSTRDHHDDARQ
jgi:putative hydrolase of the HAD superfamily